MRAATAALTCVGEAITDGSGETEPMAEAVFVLSTLWLCGACLLFILFGTSVERNGSISGSVDILGRSPTVTASVLQSPAELFWSDSDKRIRKSRVRRAGADSRREEEVLIGAPEGALGRPRILTEGGRQSSQLCIGENLLLYCLCCQDPDPYPQSPKRDDPWPEAISAWVCEAEEELVSDAVHSRLS